MQYKGRFPIMNKKCRYFDENRMAAYIENRLNPVEREAYEEHLFQCDYCLNIYFNMEQEIKLIKQARPKIIPENLLEKAINKTLPNRFKKRIVKNFSEIIIKMYEKGMEILKTVNITNLTPVPIQAVRGNKSTLLKKIILESDVKGILYKMLIEFYTYNRIKIKLNFLQIIDSLKNENIQLESPEGKIVHSFKSEALFDDLSKGTYKIKLKNITLSKINIK